MGACFTKLYSGANLLNARHIGRKSYIHEPAPVYVNMMALSALCTMAVEVSMVRAWLRFSGLATVAASLLAQTPTPDPPSLQALVAEIHQLRQELQTTTIAGQRVQIALFRLQAQTATVARASARWEEAHGKVLMAQSNEKGLTGKLQRTEEAIRNSQDPREREAATTQVLPELKAAVEREAAEEQRWAVVETEAASQLRAEQAKLDDLQALLDKLDKILDSYSRK